MGKLALTQALESEIADVHNDDGEILEPVA
jgi:hypothetical protein